MTNQSEPNQKQGRGKTIWIVITIPVLLALVVSGYFLFFRGSSRSTRAQRFELTLSPQITYAAPLTFSAPILPDASSPVPETPAVVITPTSKSPTQVPPAVSETALPVTAATVTVPMENYVVLGGVKTWSSPCYAGPGDMYEVQYEVLGGVNLLVLGRNDNSEGMWLQIRATRQKDYCWVPAKYVLLNGGDINSLAQTYPGQAL